MSEALPIPGYSERLKAAAAAVKERKELWKLAIRQRDEIIVEACDHGYAQTAAARNAEVSQPHIVRIISHSYDDVADLAA